MARSRQNRGYKKAKDAFLKTAKHECHYCGVKTIKKANQVNSITIDHIKPQSSHPHLAKDPTNFVVACRTCNSFKANMSYEQFKTLLKSA